MSEPPLLRPRHTPYAGRHRPFSIAMAPLDPAQWLELDEDRAAQLAQKRAILRDAPSAFLAEPETLAAQEEARGLIVAHLGSRGVRVAPAPDVAPLHDAATMVQDDLIIMRRGDDAYRLAAGAVCFPSSWSLPEKFGQPMNAIHAFVPGWQRMAARVARIFDNLAPGAIVWRLNWSIQKGTTLRLDKAKDEASRVPGQGGAGFGDAEEEGFSVRVERQTLRRLTTGDVLFTIKVLVDPLPTLAAHPDGPRLAAALSHQLSDLTPPEIAYKGLSTSRDSLLERLSALAAGA